MEPRPRLLLIPAYSELEWTIRPQLEEWAEVAAFDPPGVGSERVPDAAGSSAVAERAGAELDRLGWDGCVVAADEYAIAAALKLALNRPDAVQGLALGHACLSLNPDAVPPAVNAEMRSALSQMARFDDRTFVRHLTQVTQGHLGEEQADRMLERIPTGVGQSYLSDYTADDGDWIEGALRDLAKPLLLAEHRDCFVFTKEGYEAAVSAFPASIHLSCKDKPNSSAEFAEALREFCRSVVPAAQREG